MSKLKQFFPHGYQLFMKIAEPRVVRLIHFGIYLCMLVAGISVMLRPPVSFENVLGVTLVYPIGGFILGGALLSAIAVLPGVWWLERVGIILLITALLSYIVIIIYLNSSAVGLAISTAFTLTFILRWLEIRRYQLAPREE